jgi:hypothetical protein
MSPKKATVPGAALQPLDTNQDALSLSLSLSLSLQEAKIQKRKATSPTLQEEQIEEKGEDGPAGRPSEEEIDEAAEEMCHLTQDDQDRRPQHRELRQESSFNEDEWYDDFHHGNFTFDDASPVAAELHAIP